MEVSCPTLVCGDVTSALLSRLHFWRGISRIPPGTGLQLDRSGLQRNVKKNLISRRVSLTVF